MRLPSLNKILVASALALGLFALPARATAQEGTILTPADAQKLLPASVYYKGQSAPTQLRNSSGVKFADGLYLLTTMVDTSGYSSDVASKYQAYFITEAAIKIGGESLPAGIYGIGFIGGDKLVITDVGAHDVLSISTATDEGLKRPRPLQVVADAAGGFRLYAGRRYVTFSR